MAKTKRRFQRVSHAPTNPHAPTSEGASAFDVAALYRGPADQPETVEQSIPLDEKLRQAYFWIVNQAIISPYYDIEYNDGPATSVSFGELRSTVTLPSGQSYSSFVLLPLLNLAVRRRCLLVGGPGRGKTVTAILMGLLSGESLREVKRSIQHGQPQMTITDLLGNPLPKDLVNADDMSEIRIAWRRWLSKRVRIIDEYNRIPTRTQSVLLTIMADNYAELLDQIYECPEAAWYLTANDDQGGGTYQVIEALRDRIDVVVKALHFPGRFIHDLLARIEAGIRPEEVVPPEIVFSVEELDKINQEILSVSIDSVLLRRIEFFASQFEFCDGAAHKFEYKTKDTVKLSGAEVNRILASGTGTDKLKDLGVQTLNGLSVRSIMTSLVFIKAMAYFRGDKRVGMEDVRQILPFVLHDKLVPNLDAPYFDGQGNSVYRVDRIGWLRKMFDLACAEYDRLDLDNDDPLRELADQFQQGLEGVSQQEVEGRLGRIERLLGKWADEGKLYGHVYDDILQLKYLHQRYSNYLRWLKWQA